MTNSGYYGIIYFMEKIKILLLEDDAVLSETLEEYLQDLGYEVDLVEDGQKAIELIYEKSYDILLLDVNVPTISGFDLLKEVRKDGNQTPAIYMTSLNSIDDLSKGYESGCDDYIRKPFELKELQVRIQAILKREFSAKYDSKVQINENSYYDIQNNTLYIDNKEQILNNKESKLLKLFLQNRDQVLSHEKIYNTLWDYDETYSESALRTYIKNLRKLIGKERIVSIKKQGYKFTRE